MMKTCRPLKKFPISQDETADFEITNEICAELCASITRDDGCFGIVIKKECECRKSGDEAAGEWVKTYRDKNMTVFECPYCRSVTIITLNPFFIQYMPFENKGKASVQPETPSFYDPKNIERKTRKVLGIPSKKRMSKIDPKMLN